MRYMLKNKYISFLHFETQLKSLKTNHYFNDSKWKKMALPCIKKISALLRGKASKHDGNFYCLNCLH